MRPFLAGSQTHQLLGNGLTFHKKLRTTSALWRTTLVFPVSPKAFKLISTHYNAFKSVSAHLLILFTD